MMKERDKREREMPYIDGSSGHNTNEKIKSQETN